LALYHIQQLATHKTILHVPIDMTTFNEMLVAAGVDPRQVRLLRHQTKRRHGRTLYEFQQNDRAAFELYQQTQEQDAPRFTSSRYWASFIVDPLGRAIFIGLYAVERLPNKIADWDDPYTLEAVGADNDKAYAVYNTTRVPGFEQYVNRLAIEWDSQNVRSWVRYADRVDWTTYDTKLPALDTSKAIDRHEMRARLAALGFSNDHTTEKLWRMRRGKLTVYVKRETHRLPLVIHPWFEASWDRIAIISGIKTESPFAFYINSNMTAFPVWQSAKRKTASRYGLDLDCENKQSLAALIHVLDDSFSIPTPEGPVTLTEGARPSETERVNLTLARIGQGVFRRRVIDQWGGRCAVTGVDQIEVLRASHIKPWADSNNHERLDPQNGLLLAAHVDALFDRFLIGFDSEGRLIASNRLTAENLERFGLNGCNGLSSISDAQRTYLAEHLRRVMQ
jgi:hypothetical protein